MRVHTLFVGLLVMAGCTHVPPSSVPERIEPRTIHHPKPLGNGGWVTRNLFRSFWMLPSNDDDEIRIGIIPSAKTIQIRSEKNFVIRVYGEQESWDVASPGGVTWDFRFESIVRPPVMRYLLGVEETTAVGEDRLPKELEKKWENRGFFGQWFGPPKMDAWSDDDQLKRYFFSLGELEDKASASAKCREISKKWFQSCRVISRMDLPHVARGSFKAQNSTFAKEFEGVIEILPSRKGSVEVLGVKTSLMSEQTENLVFSPKIFIVPNLDGELSLVQSTTLGEYLQSVVPSEIYPNGPVEALKAQAVIARTYLFQSKNFYSDKPFLTCASTMCQVYLGEKTKNLSREIHRAVTQTENLVLKENGGSFAETFYHGASGGKTERKPWALGGAPKSYLESTNDILVEDRFDLKNSHDVASFLQSDVPTYCAQSRFAKNLRWSYQWSESEIQAFLSKAGLPGPLREIEVLQRGLSGRALSIRLQTRDQQKTINGELQIRSLFGGLPSSLAIFETEKNFQGNVTSVRIIGRGSGHGVGLSQMGAIGRANEGQDFREILSAYYPGTVLSFIEP